VTRNRSEARTWITLRGASLIPVRVLALAQP
jgi:hypothetical protein